MKNILIDWRDLTPSEKTREKVESTLKPLEYILPSDSDIRISLEKFNKNYEGHAVIRSPMGDFAAHTSHIDLISLCKNLRKNLKFQIFRYREIYTSWSQAA